jgi:hypothetical protein
VAAGSAAAALGVGAHIISEDKSMRLLIALIVIIYIVGIGVVLSPTIQAKWSGAPASNFATSVAEALPNAVAWPVRAFQSITNRG